MKKLAYFSIHELLQKKAILEVQDGNHGEQHPRQSDFVAEGIPFLTATQLLDDQIFLNKAPRISFEKAKKLRIGWIKPNDVLLSHNATVGRVSVVPLFEGQAVIGTSLTYYRLNPQFFNPHFFALVLKSQDFQNQLERSMQQTTRNQVPITRQKELKIPLPPLPEQKRIAAILEKCDRLRRTRRYSLQLSETFLQSAFLEMFGDPATNPMGWDIEELGLIGVLDRGRSKHRPRNAPELFGGSYPFIQTGDVANSSGYIKSYKQTYSEQGLKQSKLWSKGTLCITIAANIAKTGILTFDACFPDSIVGFLPHQKTNTDFIQQWFSFIQQNLEDTAPESAQKNINLEILRGLPVPLPPLPLQEKFAQIVQKHERFRTQQREAERQAEHLFQTLLHRAFRGELTDK